MRVALLTAVVWLVAVAATPPRIRPAQVARYINFTRVYGKEPKPDVFLNTAELIAARNLKPEEHHVVTEDGYILTLYRASRGQPKGPPVLIVHGILVTSDSWLVPRRADSLPLTILDGGYDVWLGDLRGNTNSKRHVYLSPKGEDYWNYSWHEHGIYDLPAFIDYILSKTGYKQLTYVGHSMGTTSFVVMASTRPKYNDKIKMAVLLAPVVGIPRGGQFPIIKLLLNFGGDIFTLLSKFGLHVKEVLPRNEYLMQITKTICGNKIYQPFCLASLQVAFRQNVHNIDKERAGYVFSAVPAGTSYKTLLHFIQIYRSGHLQQYDYGTAENMRRYNSPTPPQYDVKKITAPVALFYSLNDPFVSEKLVLNFASKLPGLVKVYQIPDQRYSHLDYVVGTSSRQVLFKSLMNVIDSRNQKPISVIDSRNQKQKLEVSYRSQQENLQIAVRNQKQNSAQGSVRKRQ